MMMLKAIIIALFVVLYGLVTFFGLGPVLLADGTPEERRTTFLIVVAVYIAITAVFAMILRRLRSRGAKS
ncbi:DUF6954 family protein [Paenibacillus sp. 2TAB19]|uniref:DUF6954 family protein n=1 Tax=Paenibacillus sp. 2TAB19 TaxID=3233003 RepID=UPI003F9CD8E9